MSKGEKSKSKVAGKHNFKVWKKVSLLLFLLFIVLLYFLPTFLSTKAGRSFIIRRAMLATGAEIDFTDISLSWFTGLELENLHYKDSVRKINFAADYVVIKPNLFSLLVKRPIIKKTRIDNARVDVWVSGEKDDNSVDNKQYKVEEASTAAGQKSVSLAKMKLTIQNSLVNIYLQQHETQKLSLDDLNVDFNLNRPGQKSSLGISSNISSNEKKSNVSLQGDFVRPKKGWSFKDNTLSMRVRFNELDLKSLEPLFVLINTDVEAQGILNADIQAEIKKGIIKNLEAKAASDSIRIQSDFLNNDAFEADNLQLDVKIDETADFYNINQLTLKADWFDVEAAGSIPVNISELEDFFKQDSKQKFSADFKIDLSRTADVFRNTLKIRDDIKLQSGELKGKVSQGILNSPTDTLNQNILANAGVYDLKMISAGKEINIDSPIEFVTELTYKDKTAMFDKMEMSCDFMKFSAKGKLSSLNYNFNTNIADTQKFVGQFVEFGGFSYTGILSGNGSFSKSSDSIIVGKINAEEFSLKNKAGISSTFEKIVVDHDLVFDDEFKNIEIKNVLVNTEDGRVVLSDSIIALKDEQNAKSLFNLETDHEIAKIWQTLRVFEIVPEKIQINGNLISKFTAEKQNNLLFLETQKARIEKFKLKSENAKPFEQDYVDVFVKGSVDLENKELDVDLKLDSPTLKIELGEINKSNQGKNSKVEANIKAVYDLKDISLLISNFLPQQLLIEGKRVDVLSFASTYPQDQPDALFKNLIADLTFGFDSAEYLGLSFKKTDFKVTVKDGILSIHPFKSSVNNGELNFSALSNLTTSKRFLSLAQPTQILKDVEINRTTTNKLLYYVNPIFADSFDATGTVNFYCDKMEIPLTGGNKNDIFIIGNLELKDVNLDSSGLLNQIMSMTSSRITTLNIRPTSFVLRDGMLSYEDMQVEVGDNPVNFKGKIFLDNRLDMIVVLPYTLSGKTVRLGQDVSDRIVLPIEGTLSNPSINLGKFIESQGKRLLEEELKKQLQKLF